LDNFFTLKAKLINLTITSGLKAWTL